MFRKSSGLWMAALVLLLFGSAGAQDRTVSDSGRVEPRPMPPVSGMYYFPVGLGLTWTYTGSLAKTEQMIRILEAEDTEEGTVYFWNGFPGDRAVRVVEGRVLERVDGTWRLLFDLNAEAGDGWEIEGDVADGDLLNGSSVEVVSRTEAVRTPYGAFEESVHLALRPAPGLADAGVMEMWFAPRLGLVKWTEQTIAGPRTFELVSFVNRGGVPIGGGSDSTVVGPVDPDFPVVPAEEFTNWAGEARNGVRYEIGTDKETYGQDEAIFIRYRVTAADREEVTFRFGSTQQYDFHLRGDGGETAWVWSAVRSFAQVVTEFTLKRGETREFVEAVDVDGEGIRGGMYRLAGFMPVLEIDGEPGSGADTEVSVAVQVEDRPGLAYLSGEVRDGNGMPVAGAQLVLSSALRMGMRDGIAPAAVTETDKSGMFRLGGMREGPYVITATAPGFEMLTQPVTMEAGYHEVRLTLKRSEGGEYANANVTAHQRLIAELATDRVEYKAGDSLYVRYRLTNPGPEAVTLRFPTGQEYDLVLEGPQGKLWQWSEGKLFTQVVSERVLEPGETFEFQAEVALYPGWARPASYLVTGFLTVRPETDEGITQAETEAMVKFRAGGEIVLPPPGTPNRLEVGMRTDRDLYGVEDMVTVEYRLINTSGEPVTLSFPSGQRYDLQLYGPNGFVWSWASTRLFIQETSQRVLAPQDTFAFREEFRPADVGAREEGAYVLKGFLTVAPRDSGEATLEETVTRVKFAVNREGSGSGESPPGPPPGPIPGSTADRGLKTYLDATFAGDSVRVYYQAVNTGPDALRLMYRSGQQYELVLTGPEGEVWRWSTGKGFHDALWEQELAPGDSIVVQEAFPVAGVEPPARGAYLLTGFLTVSPDEPDAVAAAATEARFKFTVRSEEGKTVRMDPVSISENDGAAGTVSVDFNNDGIVNFTDFLDFAGAFGKRAGMAGYREAFDLNGNGTVEFGDFVLFAREFKR